MGLQIRPFTPADYPEICCVHNAVWPEYLETPTEVRFHDERRDPKCRFQRWVAEQGGRVVGQGMHNQSSDSYHPRRFWVDVEVHPEHQGQGIGSRLYDEILGALQAFDPVLVTAGCREDVTRGVAFLQNRGFQERMRSWESRLDVMAFDPSPYADLEAKLQAEGVRILSFREMESDPDRNCKLHALDGDLGRDVPRPDREYTPEPYEQWVQNNLESPRFLPEAYFIAVCNGEYAGSCQLWTSMADDHLYNGLTGVRREFRRKGVALALKLRSVAWARSEGRPVIKTWNESNNRAMLSINERLGFVKQPAWIDMARKLAEDTE